MRQPINSSFSLTTCPCPPEDSVKRAIAIPERVLNDSAQTLLLKISSRLTLLYRFGRVRFFGLPPQLEAKAEKVWKMQTGHLFDVRYTADFTQSFAQVVDLRAFKDITDKNEVAGDYVTDVTVSFLPK